MRKNIIILFLMVFLFSSCELMEEIFLGEDSNPYEGYTSYSEADGATDSDQDGIPDIAEQSNWLYKGMPLYDWGARSSKRDIFIHVATMKYSGTDGGLLLQKDALDKVVAAFEAQNIAIHFDVGTTGLYDGDTAVASGVYDLEGLDNQIPYNGSITLSESALSNDIKTSYPDYMTRYTFVDDYHSDTTYFPEERENIFYYLVVGSSQEPDGSNGSSGVSWLYGSTPELLMTLGNWNLDFSTSSMKNVTVNFQAATIMHEFGHSLGLRHGGDENLNYKPNYYSIMNYLYQLNGLADIGNQEGDRYYLQYGMYGYSYWSQLQNSPFTTSFSLNYSHGKGGDLYEGSLNESSGLRQSGSDSVDWNGNGSINSGVYKDINTADTYYNSGISTLRDYDDWDNLFFHFSALNSGASRSILEKEPELMVEEKPDFLDQLKDYNS